MAISAFELFTIDIGPSSSLIVGPMRASRLFVELLRAVGRLEQVKDFTVELLGSLGSLGDRRPTDVPAEPFELKAVMRADRHARVRGEPGDLPDLAIEGLVTGRQRLRREHLAVLLRPDRDAVGERRTQQLFHRPGF
ncbi:MAG: hypothetical protein KDK06_09050 [Gammaproteobacteria bacterium]|nr:hypothetical protein [Gammaproteobacteria bacterium]